MQFPEKGACNMPYISQENRKGLDPVIDNLVDKIIEEAEALGGNDADFAGVLNYACSRIAAQVVLKKFGQVRYWIVALVSGVFSNIADEFYRRLAAPYENGKIRKEGDVDVYKQLLEKM